MISLGAQALLISLLLSSTNCSPYPLQIRDGTFPDFDPSWFDGIAPPDSCAPICSRGQPVTKRDAGWFQVIAARGCGPSPGIERRSLRDVPLQARDDGPPKVPSTDSFNHDWGQYIADQVNPDVGGDTRWAGARVNPPDPALEEALEILSETVDHGLCIQLPFGHQGFQAGTGRLTGCTIITIVSARAVHICHFYEGPNRDPDAWRALVWNWYTGQGPTSVNFQGVQIQTDGDQLDNTLFRQQGDNTQIFVATPYTDNIVNGQTVNGPDIRLANPLGRLISALAIYLNIPQTSVVIKPYSKLDQNSPDFYKGARGVNVFQYIPKANSWDNNNRWRLFYEDYVAEGIANVPDS